MLNIILGSFIGCLVSLGCLFLIVGVIVYRHNKKTQKQTEALARELTKRMGVK